MYSPHLREFVIVPTLKYLNMYSEAAENLVFGTCCQESNLKYLHQLGDGPAIGLPQMEPATHDDLWNNYLIYRHELRSRVIGLTIRMFPPEQRYNEMHGNLYYAIAMCRIHYFRVPKPLPDADNIEGLAAYWKQHYNTSLGKGTIDEFVHNYHRFD